MNIWTDKYEVCYQKSEILAQITVDDDYIVKDTKPDVVKVIYAQGEAVLEETRVNKDAIWITGKLRFAIVYLSDREDNCMEALASEVPFQEKLNMDDVNENDEVMVRIHQEDINVSVINSRKLSIRALIEVCANAYSRDSLELARDTGEKVEKLRKEEEILIPVENINRREKVHMQLELPGNKPNIVRVLAAMPMIQMSDYIAEDNRIILNGRICLGVLYEGQGTGLEWYQFEEEISQELQEEAVEKDDILWMMAQMEQSTAGITEDFDGENRCISFDVCLQIQGNVYREEKLTYLMDMYSLEKDLKLSTCENPVLHFLMKNVAKTRVCQQLSLEPQKARMLSICTYWGEVELDSWQMEPGGVLIEGILKTEIIYMTNQDQIPLGSALGQIPFRQHVELKDRKEDSKCRIHLSLESLQMNLMDQGMYEVMAGVNIAVLAYDEKIITNIVGAEEIEGESKTEPGMIGYTVREGDSLWNIAKKYKCTMEDIKRTNELTADTIRPEQKLLIVKFYK